MVSGSFVMGRRAGPASVPILQETGPALRPTQPPVKWVPGRAADHSPPSSAAVMEQYSYTFTHPLGHAKPVTGLLYL